MARKKIETSSTTDNDVLLTPSEVWDVLEFAANYTKGYYGNNALTPDLVNSRLKDISLNPLAATQTDLENALANPKDSETQLQGFSENFELISQPYKRLISFLANMLSFDLTYTCINAEKGDYNSPKYKKDYKIVRDFFDRFDYRKEFNIATKEMLRNETFVFCPRFDSNQYTLQELPASPTYLKITGRWDYGFLMSFSMLWFILPGVSVDFYPSFFKKKYMDFWGDGKIPMYDPTLSAESRGASSWTYWVDLPSDVSFAFKLSSELATRVPYFSPMFLDLLDQGLTRNLQKNINLSAASRIIAAQVPMLKDPQSKNRDQFAISPANLGNFLALVKSAIGDTLKVTAVPLEGIQGITFPAVNDLYQSYLNTTMATSGVNTDLIFSGNTRPNVMATQLSLNVDEQLMQTLYPQFEQFLNYTVNKLTTNFKFRFKFQGTQFFNNRQNRFDKQMTLMQSGICLPQQLAASIGMSPWEFEREMEQARATGFSKKLTPIQLASQMSADSQKRGRPQKSDSELSEEGSQTRKDGGNISKGGNI